MILKVLNSYTSNQEEVKISRIKLFFAKFFPIKIDGNNIIRTFKVYIGKGKWDIVSFLIDDEQMVQSGSVEINILNFIEYAFLKLDRMNNLYLQGIEFGTEFTNNWQIYTFVLNKFDIQQTFNFGGI